MASGRRIRLKMPGWRNGTFIRRAGNVPKRTFEDWRDLAREAYREGYYDVLDALADRVLDFPQAKSLHRVGGLLAVRARLEELKAEEDEQAKAVAAGETFPQWFAEFLEQQPRRKAGRQVSERQHATIVRTCEMFLDFLVERHELKGPEFVRPEHWTRDALRSYTASYVKTRLAAAKKRLEKKWAAMDNPPNQVDRTEMLRIERGRKVDSANHHVNHVGAMSKWLMERDRIPYDPAVGVRLSARAVASHRQDEHRALTRKEWSRLLHWSRVMDEEQGRGPDVPDSLWYEFLVRTGATTYTEGTRVRVSDIRLDRETRQGLVPVQMLGSKAEARKRKVWVSRAFAERLIERAKTIGAGRNGSIFPYTPSQGRVAWDNLMRFVEDRDPSLAARIEGVTLYALRHTFAYMALKAGVDIYQLKKLMGHANITTTEIYLRHAQSPHRALSRMAKALEQD